MKRMPIWGCWMPGTAIGQKWKFMRMINTNDRNEVVKMRRKYANWCMYVIVEVSKTTCKSITIDACMKLSQSRLGR
jgi:hypothetical protein